jgi:hypothetical protein
MPYPLPEVDNKIRGARLKHEGLEIPCLYFKMEDTALMNTSRVMIIRSVLNDVEIAAMKQESQWDYIMMAKDDIEMDCVFPSNDVALFGFRTFLWHCPERAMVTVRPDSFRTVVESFKLSIFKTFDVEQNVGNESFDGIVSTPVVHRPMLFIDNRHIHVDKPIDWRGQFPTVDSGAITPRARFDSPFFTLLLHEDWTMEQVKKERK